MQLKVQSFPKSKMPNEIPQNHEAAVANTPESRMPKAASQINDFQRYLNQLHAKETQFTLGTEPQIKIVKTLLPVLEAGIQNRLNKLAQATLINQDSFDKKLDGFLKKNILLSEADISLPTGHGTLSIGEVGDQTAIGFSATEGLSFQAVIDGADVTKVRLFHQPDSNSEISAGYNPEDQTVEASYAKKWSGQNYDAKLGTRAFHNPEENNTGVNVAFTIKF